MNPLTQVKRIQKINSREVALGISEEASWHAIYKGSAYMYVGGIPYDLTEGDLAVFAQYGEIVDVNLVRDKGTGKSKGFAFVAYEDQRSTILAVDNLNGATILNRIVRVDHVSNYKKKEEEEDDEKAQQRREARGVCHAYKRGECNRGAACKYSHDEQGGTDSVWGRKDSDSRWGHDDPPKSHKNFSYNASKEQSELGSKSREWQRDDTRSRDDKYSGRRHTSQESKEDDKKRSKTYSRLDEQKMRVKRMIRSDTHHKRVKRMIRREDIKKIRWGLIDGEFII